MGDLLHSENLDRLPFGGTYLRKLLEKRAVDIRRATSMKADPNISVVIRTKNDMASLPTLFADLWAQEFSGQFEIIVVDTESTDGTAQYARSRGAKVVSLSQAEFNYPRALNLGFTTAKYDYVVTLVGHSSLTSQLFFRVLTRWHDTKQFGGVFGFPLSDQRASMTERICTVLWTPHYIRRDKVILHKTGGLLGANCAIVSRKAWQKMGRFDERYAAGGEDAALGARMLEAGMFIVRDPLCTVFHSHGLGPINGVRQVWHWRQVAKPRPFEERHVLARRPDLRSK